MLKQTAVAVVATLAVLYVLNQFMPSIGAKIVTPKAAA